jgi:pilus assembly protein CpaE
MVKVLLVEDNSGDAELVQEMLAEAEGAPFTILWSASLWAGLDRLAEEQVDVVLLDLFLPDCHGLETFTALRAHAPGVPVVVLTGLDSEAVAMAAVREGAQDYLVKGKLESESLVRALRYALVRHSKQAEPASPEERRQAGMVGLLGAKGGVGVTTLACHLALELRRQAEEGVLVVDLDLNAGLLGFLLKASASFSILDAVKNILRLDVEGWKSMVSSGTGGLKLLPAPSAAPLEELPPAGRICHVLRFARLHYRWIVADLGRLTAFSVKLLKEFDELLLVTTDDVTALREALRAGRQILDSGFPAEHLRLVLDGAPRSLDIPVNDVEQVVGLPVYAVLPEDGRQLRKAGLRGELLAEDSALRQSIARLAARLAGAADQPGEAKSRRTGWNLRRIVRWGANRGAPA